MVYLKIWQGGQRYMSGVRIQKCSSSRIFFLLYFLFPNGGRRKPPPKKKIHPWWPQKSMLWGCTRFHSFKSGRIYELKSGRNRSRILRKFVSEFGSHGNAPDESDGVSKGAFTLRAVRRRKVRHQAANNVVSCYKEAGQFNAFFVVIFPVFNEYVLPQCEDWLICFF